MRHHLKWPKQPSIIQYLLLFPIIGLLDLKDDFKRSNINEFTISWVIYILGTVLWCMIASAITYVICTRPMILLIPMAIVLLLVGLPRIIYKLANRKPRK